MLESVIRVGPTAKSLLILMQMGGDEQIVFLAVPTDIVNRENLGECDGYEVQSESCPEPIRNKICSVFYRANLTYLDHSLPMPVGKSKKEKALAHMQIPDDWQKPPGPERDLAQYKLSPSARRRQTLIDNIIVMSFSV